MAGTGPREKRPGTVVTQWRSSGEVSEGETCLRKSAWGGWTPTIAEDGQYVTNQDDLLQEEHEKETPNALDNGNGRGGPWD